MSELLYSTTGNKIVLDTIGQPELKHPPNFFCSAAGSFSESQSALPWRHVPLPSNPGTCWDFRDVWNDTCCGASELPWDPPVSAAKDDKIQDELRGIAGNIDSLKKDLPCTENQDKAKQSADLLREIAAEIDQVEKYQDLLGGPCPF